MPAGRRSAVFLAFGVVAALSLAGLATASLWSLSSAAPGTPAAAPNGFHRNVVWYGVPQSSPRSLHIESTSVGAPVQDEFQITYSAGNFTLAYQRIAGGPVTTQYTMTVQGLTEWNDTSGDGHIEDGTVVAYTALGNGAFSRFPIVHSSMTTTDGVGVNSFVMPSNRGDVALNLTIADGFVRMPSGENLTPMEAKLTLEINHTMTFPDTRLALQLTISTDQTVIPENQSWDDQNNFSADDRALNVTNGGGPNASSAFFAWSNSASVNGVVGTVIPSGLISNDTMPGFYDFYLTYPQQGAGSLQLHIVHDPTIGVVSAAYLSSLLPQPTPVLPFQPDVYLYVVSLAAIAVVVAGTAVLVRRRRQVPP